MRKPVVIAFLVLFCAFASFSWSFDLSPVSCFQPLSKEEQQIEKEIMQYGYPDTATLRYRTDYVLSYDGRNRVPHWVCEHLNAERLKGDADRKKSKFKEDPSIPVEFRSTLNDYKGSGFDRGHMAPAADHKSSQKAMDDTFFLSNMSPQVGIGFNRDYWSRLEDRVREWALSKKELYVYTGPLYIPEAEADGKKYVKYQVIGGNNVAVPTHFFKVILAEMADGRIEMLAFVLPNRKIPPDTALASFLASVDEVERLSGLDFFNVLDRETQERMEKERQTRVWGSE